MQSYSPVSALILAGGQSSRMGTDKAVLEWQGVPLLRRVYDVASICCEQVQVITPWPQRYDAILPRNAQFRIEKYPNRGPLWAVAQGLSHCSTEWVWVLACDLPLLDPLLCMPWLSSVTTMSEEVLAIAPLHPWKKSSPQKVTSTNALNHRKSAHWEPLCALYRQRGLESLLTFLNAGGYSFQEWLGQINVQPIAITEANQHLFYNCNSPSDLASGASD